MLKNYDYYQSQRHTILTNFMITILMMAIVGIFISPLTWEKNPSLISFQLLLILSLFIALTLFIKKNKDLYKTIFIILLTIYFCSKFWTYPETAVMLCILAIAPIIPIFLFDKKGFYIVASFNVILGPAFIYLIANTDLKETYTYLATDAFGNTVNYIVVQVILLFAFFATNNKIKTIKAYHKELEQAKQENSISQLAASIAHEIRTPITVVKGFAQLLEQNSNLGNREKEYVKSILNELNYTELIITDYISLAKPQSLKIQTMELNAEIQKVADLLLNFARQQHISISLSLNDNIYVKIDPIELKQVLVNIIKNGVESMNAHNVIQINSCQIGNMARITISDQGIGMTKEQVEQLGTPFYSLKECGTGIGLTVCYNIIHKYKGEIEVESEPGVGTTFSIYLPLYD
ncbi:MAG: ATP-binding protein [Bacillus sp. (in: firmicutes)]